MNLQAKVGLFIFLIFLVAGYLVVTFDSGIFNKSKKEYYAYFEEAPGLSIGTDVSVKGIKAGKVEDITLEDGKVKIKIGMSKDIPIYKNAKVYIRTMGLMGDKYIYIDPGTPDTGEIASGGLIRYTKRMATTEDTFESISKLVDNLNEALGNGKLAKLINDIDQLAVETRNLVAENRENLKKSIDNIEKITSSLKENLPDLIAKIQKVADNLEKITGENREDIRELVKSLKETAKSLQEKAPKTLEDIDLAAKEIKSTFEENKASIKASIEKIKSSSAKLDRILAKIDEGKGTLGKLVNDNEMYDNINEGVKAISKPFKVILDSNLDIYLYGEKHTGNKDTKAGMALTLAPNYDRYIYLGLLSNSNGSIAEVEEIKSGNNTYTRVKRDLNILVDIQYARALLETKMGNLWVRAGLKESSASFGIDWWFNKRIRLTSDLYKFDRKYSTIGIDKPELDAGIFYKFKTNPFYIRLGASDILSNKYRGIYIGAGLMFSDEYLKYMLGGLGGLKP